MANFVRVTDIDGKLVRINPDYIVCYLPDVQQIDGAETPVLRIELHNVSIKSFMTDIEFDKLITNKGVGYIVG